MVIGGWGVYFHYAGVTFKGRGGPVPGSDLIILGFVASALSGTKAYLLTKRNKNTPPQHDMNDVIESGPVQYKSKQPIVPKRLIRPLSFSFWIFVGVGFGTAVWINEGNFDASNLKDILIIALVHLGTLLFGIFVYLYFETSRKFYEKQKVRFISRKLLCLGMPAGYIIGCIAYVTMKFAK